VQFILRLLSCFLVLWWLADFPFSHTFLMGLCTTYLILINKLDHTWMSWENCNKLSCQVWSFCFQKNDIQGFRCLLIAYMRKQQQLPLPFCVSFFPLYLFIYLLCGASNLMTTRVIWWGFQPRLFGSEINLYFTLISWSFDLFFSKFKSFLHLS
jgi:hypothetical protein